jgi:hypothetical protein
MLRRIAGTAVAAMLWAFGAASAQPSLPWMPDAAGRHDVQLLADEAALDLPTTQWPLPHDAVARAIDALPAALPPHLHDARMRLQRQLASAARPRLALRLSGTDEALTGFGDDAVPGSALTFRSARVSAPHLAMQLGLRLQADRAAADPRPLRFAGSAIATEALGVQLQAWSRTSWWGPGWHASLVLGNNAPALLGIGLQRASASRSTSPWLSWLGPWNAELFAARADGSEQAFIIGQRLTMRPWSGVEIGLTRATQWGGRGKPQTLTSLARAVLGRNTNIDDTSQMASDPGSGIGGFDLRLRCPWGLGCSVYAQLIGEDEAGGLPSKYLGLYGIEHAFAGGTQRLALEFVDSTCGTVPHGRPRRGCAYRNHAYTSGYASAGRWLGTSAGPDTQLLTLGWLDAERDSALKLHAGRIGSRIGSFSPLVDDPQHAGHVFGVGARQGFRWRAVMLRAEVDWLRLRASEGSRSDARASLSVAVDL